MNSRVMNALRKVAADVEITRDHEPSMSGVRRMVTTAPGTIKGAMDQYMWDNAPQYQRDYINRMQELWGNTDTAERYAASMGKRGKAALKFLNELASKKLKDNNEVGHEHILDLIYNKSKDLKHEADTAGVNLGSAGSYGLSMLGLGALGRLIAGKKHSGWGWGLGIGAGALANYLRRKSYYGDNISI